MTLEVVDYCFTSIIELALLPISQPTPIHVYPMIHLDLRQIRGSIWSDQYSLNITHCFDIFDKNTFNCIFIMEFQETCARQLDLHRRGLNPKPSSFPSLNQHRQLDLFEALKPWSAPGSACNLCHLNGIFGDSTHIYHSYGHLLGLYNWLILWDYTFHKWGHFSTYHWHCHNCTIPRSVYFGAKSLSDHLARDVLAGHCNTGLAA